jgi:imidazolonepropionase-like amidohydrolase
MYEGCGLRHPMQNSKFAILEKVDMRRSLLLWVWLLSAFFSSGQETFPRNGVKDDPTTPHLFINATVHVSPQQEIKNGFLFVKEGRVVKTGAGTADDLKKGAIVHDLKGRHIYASFIEPYSTYGVKQPEKKKKENRGPQYDGKKTGAFAWNDALNPENDASELFEPDAKKAKELRKLGFGATVSLVDDGISKGTSACVLIGDGQAHENLLQSKVAAHYSFKKGTSHQNYPSSLMGSIALIRQTYFDAEWYSGNPDPLKETNLGLEAWNATQSIPQVFAVTDLLSTFRADKVGDEFGVQYIFKGSGNEYRRVEAIKQTGGSFIIPLKFPDVYDVEDPYDAMLVDYSDMLHWELAPGNAAKLKKAGVDFCFTTNGLKKSEDVLKAMKAALKAGLDSSDAIAAWTTVPAKMFGLSDLGSLDAGKVANFIITSDKMFRKDSKVLENWVGGNRYMINEPTDEKLDGKYKLTVGASSQIIEVTGTLDKPKGKIFGEDTLDVNIKIDHELVTISYREKKKEDVLRLSGRRSGDTFVGEGKDKDGNTVKWSLVRTGNLDPKEKKEDKKEEAPPTAAAVVFPFMGYGNLELPKAEKVLFKNATVWTNESDGVVEGTDVLLENGKISAVGKGLDGAGAKEVDGTGKHLTAGIIDEHSHIAISRGVNEGTQAVTAEVSIADVVNSEDVNIYRQLAGGVVASQLLHGSANPIGGQSGLIKMRWGQLPEDMKIDWAPGHIKFALGENVKQSNWGDLNTVRYPQTRMGVEQVFYDAFHRAKAYKAEWAAYNSSKKKGAAPRRDLELDIVVEIMDSKRFVTCHSYVQSEINMLMHVADSMGWKMNTFTHILEGYKVADKMKAHGVNGSTFSDWWAYKFEVNDAIPYNAAIMHSQGVNVGINSDDAEMGRRLNQEAAKGVKYGGMSEEDAWKMVTLNPAKMLKLDKRMGSIKVGKDADVVLWSDNPLSIYAKAEKTLVDGVCYFDLEEDKKKREWIKTERNRITQKMLRAKKRGDKTQKPSKKEHKHYHCDTLEP